MTEKEAGKLCERYYHGTSTQQKPEGTGLGLAITKNIIELHGVSFLFPMFSVLELLFL